MRETGLDSVIDMMHAIAQSILCEMIGINAIICLLIVKDRVVGITIEVIAMKSEAVMERVGEIAAGAMEWVGIKILP